MHTSICFLRKKFEVFSKFKDFKALVQNQRENKIKVLRIDNGGEFCRNEFEQLYKKNGISRKKNSPYTPQQNGVCKRRNTTLREKQRNKLSSARIGQELQVEVVDTTCYFVNLSPTSSLVEKTL